MHLNNYIRERCISGLVSGAGFGSAGGVKRIIHKV